MKKKVIALFLTLTFIFALAACGTKKNEEQPTLDEQGAESVVNPMEEPKEESTEEPKEESAKPEDKKEEDKKEEAKPTPTAPVLTPKPTETEQNKPSVNPQPEPEEKPQTTPQPTPEAEAKTVGQKLLKDFYGKASSASGALSLAEALAKNETIPFPAATMEVTPGFLAGFDNTEIKGFREGATFGPIIGSIPFVGYVFVLEDGTNPQSFISALRSAANLRWNICVEAEEMVTGSVGNKVFFVMCPKEFSEE